MKPQDIGILVLSDMPVEARQIVSLLADDFPLAASSTDESRHVDDFDARKPDILLLAFRHLELAERHALGLLRHSEQAGLLARAQEIENLTLQQRAQQMLADDAKTQSVRLEAAYTEAAQRLASVRREATEAQTREIVAALKDSLREQGVSIERGVAGVLEALQRA